MTIVFGEERKWMKKALSWFFAALFVVFSMFLETYLHGYIRLPLVIIQLVLIALFLYQAVHHMNKQNKAYIKVDDHQISIYRSSWTPMQKVDFSKVIDFYEVGTLMILRLKSNQEVPFETDLFSEQECREIKKLIGEKSLSQKIRRENINE